MLVAEWMDDAGLEALGAASRVTCRPELAENRSALLALLPEADALVVRNRVRVDAQLLAAGRDRLRAVGRLGSGIDNIDVHACRAAGVHVVQASGANAQAVCEYVFAGLLHLLRRLHAADAAVRAGSWPRGDFLGGELSGRTLGLIGLGAVGARVATCARALGMPVLGHDPLVLPGTPACEASGAEWCPFGDVLVRSDIVSLHLPLSRETHHLLGAAQLRRMRRGAILVNTARGGLVDEAALCAALAEGRLGGAVIDVREREPPGAEDPLAKVHSVLLTPHVAGWTQEAQRRVGLAVAHGVLSALEVPARVGGLTAAGDG